MIETRRPAADPAQVAEAALDSNESPIGPPQAAVQAAVDGLSSLHRYPRRAHQKLISVMADKWKVDAESLIVTNGVDEAIDLVLPLANSVVCTVPGFDAFWTRPESQGIPVTRIPLDDDGQPTVSPHQACRDSLAFIARPNNPTGTIIGKSWVDALREVARLAVVDETYIDFSCDEGFLRRIGGQGDLCVFRSLSKSLGLAGLRIGALVSTPALAARLRERQRFYPADTISLQAATAALADDEYIERHSKYVIDCRTRLSELLKQSALFVEVRDTQANFVIARCADATAAADMERQLREHDVLVRECALFGYPGRLRISAGSPRDLQKLRSAIADIAWKRSRSHHGGS